MGKLINADKLLENQYRIDDSATLSTRDVVDVEDIEDAPTVEAITKTEYENRLKADKLTMLEELKKEVFVELAHADADGIMVVDMDDYNNLIQQKINELKGVSK